MIRKFELFAGYGSHSLTLKKYGVDYKSAGISEIDEHAILTYEAVHCDNVEIEYPSVKKMLEFLIEGNIGMNFETGRVPWTKMLSMETLTEKMLKRVKRVFKACFLTKNYGDITKINAEDLPDMDLMTYSFPCTNISIIGKQEGLEEHSGTKSSLLWECEKIIKVKKPKYLMMENVKALVGKQFKGDFDRWLGILEGLGYNNHWKVVNAKNCGIPQNRERVFCVSILKECDDFGFHFYSDFDLTLGVKDFLEDEVDERYYLNESRVDELLEGLKTKGNKLEKLKEEINSSEDSRIVCERRYDEGIRFFSGDYVGTITTPSSGGNKIVVEVINMKYRIRSLTPRECFRLMGVLDTDIDKIINTGITNTQLYKMAGNSIVVDAMKFLKQLK